MSGSAETWQRSTSFTLRVLRVSQHRGHEGLGARAFGTESTDTANESLALDFGGFELRSAASDAWEMEIEAGIHDLLALISFEPLISSALSDIVECRTDV